jgi:hypothetical protein
MLRAAENLVLAFYHNATYALVRAVNPYSAIFGGPPEYSVAGKSYGPCRLHHIASLGCSFLQGALGRSDLFANVPLVYGMCYDGCRLRYQYGYGKITILELNPRKSSEGWPYPDYPAILPYCPLALGERKKMPWRKFIGRFPNMPDQQPTELVVVVPPPMTLGVSLWGPTGDAEGVAIVFECDLETQQVSAYNVCS